MTKKIQNILLILIIFVLHFSFLSINSQAQVLTTEEEEDLKIAQRTIYIYNFTKYIEWPDFKKLTEFKIGILGAWDEPLVKEFNTMAEKRMVKGKPIIVEHFISIEEITKTQILYVNKKSNFDIYEILQKINKNYTLLVSENYPFHKSMINFIDVDGKFEFELNEIKIKEEGLVVPPSLVSFSIESTADWHELYLKTEKSLEKERIKVEKQQAEIKQQKNEIRTQNKEINKQKDEILVQMKEIESQKKELNHVFQEIEKQEKILQSQIELAKKQEEKNQAAGNRAAKEDEAEFDKVNSTKK